MKTKHLKAAGAAVSLLIASGPALATSTGPQTLLAFPEATDVFQFTCPAGTVNVKWIVSDTTVIVNVPARIRMGMTNVGQIRFSVAEDKSPSPGGEGGLSSEGYPFDSGNLNRLWFGSGLAEPDLHTALEA